MDEKMIKYGNPPENKAAVLLQLTDFLIVLMSFYGIFKVAASY